MKRPLGEIPTALLVLVLATGAATRAQAQTLTVLHSFTNAPDGAFPFAGLLRDAAGNLYGTTEAGGPASLGCGTVFKLDPAGNETVLYSFCTAPKFALDAFVPFASLIMDATGNLYGTTRNGGSFGGGSLNFGTVFKVDSSGNETVLHSFALTDGAAPEGGLIMDTVDNLYGTTPSGGAGGQAGFGIVFKLDPLGNLTVLHSFTGSDGANPVAGLIMDKAGNLYGTTVFGGAFNQGTVFKLTCNPSCNLTVLHNFNAFATGGDGLMPYAGLIMDAAGNLYGTTLGGGSGTSSTCQGAGVGCGTVFKFDALSGNETVLYSFKGGNDGAVPYAGLVMDALGNLYGTTNQGGPGPCTGANAAPIGCGTVFKLDTAGNETILHNFTGGSDGAFPRNDGHLVLDAAGNLYGTASSFLALGGYGTVFKITGQTPAAPTITSISPTSAIAGGAAFTLTVSGTNFVSGSTVDFNGNARATTFVSAAQLTAAILASDIATAGGFNVTVTNPSGAGTSNAVSFTVVTPEQATQTIINSVNTLFSQGVINAGQDNSLVVQLQHASNLMNAGKNAGAIGNLESFISEVNDLLSSGVLFPAQAVSLVSAAQSVIAALP